MNKHKIFLLTFLNTNKICEMKRRNLITFIVTPLILVAFSLKIFFYLIYIHICQDNLTLFRWNRFRYLILLQGHTAIPIPETPMAITHAKRLSGCRVKNQFFVQTKYYTTLVIFKSLVASRFCRTVCGNFEN